MVTRIAEDSQWMTNPNPVELEPRRFAALKYSGGNLVMLRNAIRIANLDIRDFSGLVDLPFHGNEHRDWIPEGMDPEAQRPGAVRARNFHSSSDILCFALMAPLMVSALVLLGIHHHFLWIGAAMFMAISLFIVLATDGDNPLGNGIAAFVFWLPLIVIHLIYPGELLEMTGLKSVSFFLGIALCHAMIQAMICAIYHRLRRNVVIEPKKS